MKEMMNYPGWGGRGDPDYGGGTGGGGPPGGGLIM